MLDGQVDARLDPAMSGVANVLTVNKARSLALLDAMLTLYADSAITSTARASCTIFRIHTALGSCSMCELDIVASYIPGNRQQE